ncbi:Fumarylacetoacetate (FAA) hydrolase family protein [Faunimonas pinastri]|uniref:Fumarylacetoacetate (FAA) hydrolase family protein n=1 Tax=Faunimonas pinastri TaxID=1855383 RepID=A0A1H9FZ84_9HYPH|nr:fumarylacetoacetate hydrolase family protein [Faunimonas pinastri]SEQ42788.1 Fumarylacetoacetate (FAA) hydrolase family protein [Faunimonas pinastri]
MQASDILPAAAERATLVARVHDPELGPCVVHLRAGELVDITDSFPTISDLLDEADPAAAAKNAPAGRSWSLEEVVAASFGTHHGHAPQLLAPCDLQALKACGVTFARSMLERVIEERCKGDPGRAAQIRQEIGEAIGGALSEIKAGSEDAQRAKDLLISRGYWSQYLEVGIGPDAEVFTKAQPLSAVGPGAEIGILRASSWNNPEPEVVLAVNARGEVRGAALGNDVNLRDLEGRSALLLGKAKDNNGSTAIGPFIRLFDAGFGMDDVRRMRIDLRVTGAGDGFVLNGQSSMAEISRDPLDLVAHAMGRHHQYPDGMMLFLGTLFAPTEDRDVPGQGFTHKPGDVVEISSPELGRLVNRVGYCDVIEPWTFGVRSLMASLRARASRSDG